MKFKNRALLLLLLAAGSKLVAQAPPKPYGALPNQAQLNWHQMEMYCIIHFGADTYTDKEWGFGDEDPAIVNPKKFDALQIVAAAKAGGFKGVVIVAKHHDGLCLWPTKTTPHNITQSPWRSGKGDMIKEYQLACQKLGMKLGLYCSPWDRNNAAYGKPEYLDIYQKQIKELYTNYGPIFISWHDGANGGDGYYGGAREVRKIDRSVYYDWKNTWAIVRQLQPNAAIFGDIGPDVRWVGNEEGHAGETCWETYTPHAPDEGKEPANGYSKYQEATTGTLNGKYWMPAECDVPLRPGWFYHASQDDQVKTPYQLLNLYYNSVGRGSDLDLGLAPNRDGLLSAQDVSSIKTFGTLLQQTFKTNLLKGAVLTAGNIRGNNKAKFGPAYLLDNNRYSYWATDDNVKQTWLEAMLPAAKTFNVIRLRENIKLGQRITAFQIDVKNGASWKTIAHGTSIGANRLIRLSQYVNTRQVRLTITSAEASIVLSDFGLFCEPPHLSAPMFSRDKAGNVNITTETPVSSVHYTLDGSEPGLQSPVFKSPVPLLDGGTIKARSFQGDRLKSDVITRSFGISKAAWKVLETLPQTRKGGAAAIDDDETTLWTTTNSDPTAEGQFPQYIVVDMGKDESISAFTYLPRQDKNPAGMVQQYMLYVSTDATTWTKVAAGEFSNIQSNPLEQLIKLTSPVKVRYFKFSVLSVFNGNGVSAAEIGVRR